jgi:hypothetical protein
MRTRLNFTRWRWLLPMVLAICGAPASAGDTMPAATEPTSQYSVGGQVSLLPHTADGRLVLHGSARYSDQASDASGRFSLHKTLGAGCSLSDDLFSNGFEGGAASPDVVLRNPG